MKPMIKHMFFPLLFAFSSTSFAAELFHDLDPETLRKVEEYNAAYIANMMQFASRYRIVEANADILFTDEAFTITPFDDVGPLVFEKRNLSDQFGDASFVIWNGAQNIQTYIDTIQEAGQYTEKVEDALKRQASLSIYVHKNDVDENNEATDINQRRSDALGALLLNGMHGREDSSATQSQSENEENKKTFYAVESESINYIQKNEYGEPVGQTRFRFEYMQFTPRYTFVFEVDPGYYQRLREYLRPCTPEDNCSLDQIGVADTSHPEYLRVRELEDNLRRESQVRPVIDIVD